MSNERVIITVTCMVYRENEFVLQDRVAEKWPGVTFPGGHVEQGESFVEAAIREMKEETGLTVDDLKMCGIKQLFSENNEHYIVILFKTNSFTGTLRSSREGEVMWVSREEVDVYPLVPDFKELLQVFDSEALEELVYRYDHATNLWNIELH